jgi:acyl-CoA hydrolase
MKVKSVSESVLYTAQIMTPNDANFMGKVFGGVILSMMDLHAYATASRFAEAPCVTASFDRVDFHHPIEVGALVRLKGYISYVGRTSLEVTLEVTAEHLQTGMVQQTNMAHVTMVALKDGKPTEVPRLLCETREEKLQFLEGHLRRQKKIAHERELKDLLRAFGELSEEELNNLIREGGGRCSH